MDMILIDLGRVGIGTVFLFIVFLDFWLRPQIFDLMEKQRVPWPWLFFIGAVLWKTLTSLALIFDFYAYYAALLLALYVFLAMLVFNNFWAVPKEKQGPTLVLFVTHLAICFGLLVVAGVSYGM